MHRIRQKRERLPGAGAACLAVLALSATYGMSGFAEDAKVSSPNIAPQAGVDAGTVQTGVSNPEVAAPLAAVAPAAALPVAPATVTATDGDASVADTIPEYSKVALIGDVSTWSQSGDFSKSFGGGLQWTTDWIQGSVVIKSDGTGDDIAGTANHRYGDFLLLPSAAKIAVAVDLAYWKRARKVGRSRLQHGYIVNVVAGSSNWAPDSVAKRSVVGAGLGLGYGARFGSRACSTPLQCWSVQFGGGVAGRALLGDGGQSHDFREAAIGPHAGRAWAGLFGGVRVSVAYVTLGMDIYLLGGNSLQGLTGGQLVPTISAVVPIEVASSTTPASSPDAGAPTTTDAGAELAKAEPPAQETVRATSQTASFAIH